MAAPATYRVVIITSDRPGDAADLEVELQRQVTLLGSASAALEIVHVAPSYEDYSDPGSPPSALVVLTRGQGTESDEAVASAIGAAQAAMIPVLPVCSRLSNFTKQVPAALHPVNGRQWRAGESAELLASEILRLVGLCEDDRRIFLSYRRTDGMALAEQLRQALIDARWDVFLDRFSVPPAVDFQARLDRELADKAFVLLVESPDASGSEWVDHEISFALRHRMGLMGLTLPSTTATQLFPALDESWRLRLKPIELTGRPTSECLRASALAQVVADIEARHASALRLRKESVLADAARELSARGFGVTHVDDWILLGTRSTRQEVVCVTGRSPRPEDLRRADGARRRLRARGKQTHAWLVHPTEDVDADRVSLLRWLAGRRQISASPLLLFGSRLTP